MNEDTTKKADFLLGIVITLSTIIIGLVSYIFYTENIELFTEPKRCEYNGWSYANKETYQSIDECNTCICVDGETVCTLMECVEE
jgi:hypothetical protein